MKRVQEIKQKREAQFIRNRLDASKDKALNADLKEVQLDIGLLQNPPGRNRVRFGHSIKKELMVV